MFHGVRNAELPTRHGSESAPRSVSVCVCVCSLLGQYQWVAKAKTGEGERIRGREQERDRTEHTTEMVHDGFCAGWGRKGHTGWRR